MDMNFSVFQEPRGVMRILQFVFSICAFATTCNYVGYVQFACEDQYKFEFDYPFNLYLHREMNLGKTSDCHPRATVIGNYTSDVTFFVATGVIAMLYCLLICVLYTKYDELYKNKPELPLVDFLLTVIIAVLWLSSSACWANSLTGLKNTVDPANIKWDNYNTTNCSPCRVQIGSFSSLNISVLLGFLNFFLWASDLWFLYKETNWFQRPPVEG